MTTQMRAWQASSPGSFSTTLTLTSIPRPSGPLQPGQVLVEVSRAGLNPADYKMCEVGFASRMMTTFPKTPGMDLAGRIVDVAEDVTDVKKGDTVMARATPTRAAGSLSEQIVVDHDGYTPIPESFDLDQAAGAPTAGLTAYQSIAPYVKSGDSVFLNGGSGGVGLFGIQVAKALGCHVTVTCSSAKAELCKSLGADDIIDYKNSDVLTELQKNGQVFAVCVDNVGNSPPNLYASSHTFLKEGAKFIFVGGAIDASNIVSLSKSLMLPGFLGGGKRKFTAYMTNQKRADLEQIRDWLVEGKVRSVIGPILEFKEADKAIQKLREGLSTGKIIVRVQEK
ncbi:chaperonin 10-like protein [Dactylonectria macrodidyma]|uniref:Chaperonin 10-like protein n=1 Tax=Dactylonectria macrodidyma TaxID=307937 RepID=A0A9P9F8W7_9HYPO|nr:chaperonin 10-like protein [Dactylonectria macrodidyma]